MQYAVLKSVLRRALDSKVAPKGEWLGKVLEKGSQTWIRRFAQIHHHSQNNVGSRKVDSGL